MSKTIYSKEYKRIFTLLKQAKLYSGLTQKQVAKKMGWKHHHYISKMENGKRRIDIIELAKLAEIYKEPLSKFTHHLENKYY